MKKVLILLLAVIGFASSGIANEAVYSNLSNNLLSELKSYQDTSQTAHSPEHLRSLSLKWLDTINEVRKNAGVRNPDYFACISKLQQATDAANSLLEDAFDIEDDEGNGELSIDLGTAVKSFIDVDMKNCLLWESKQKKDTPTATQ